MKRAIKDNTTNSKSYKDKSAFNHDYPEQSADGALGDGGTSRVAFKTRTGLGKPTKRSRLGISRYIDDMAEEEEEEDNNEKLAAARLRVDEEDREMRSEIQRQDRRRNQENFFEGSDADVAGVVKSLHERYQRTTQLVHDLDDIDEGIPYADKAHAALAASRHAATRQANAPSLADPRLWAIPCKLGCEREAVLSLMNKCAAMTCEGTQMRICSAMTTSLRGFIYVESRSEPDVRMVAKGLRLLRSWSMKMVPMVDMVAVLSTSLDASYGYASKRNGLRIGDWARVSRDTYRGDLCRIVALGNGGSSAVIMLVPRLDVSSDTAEAGVFGRKDAFRKMRPPMRLFNASEIIAAGGNVTQRRFRLNTSAGSASQNWALADETFDVFENASYLKGYLYKEVNVTTMLKRGGADPTLDELQRFVIDTQEMGPGDNEPSSVVKYPADDEQKRSLKAQIELLARGRGTQDPTQKSPIFEKDDKVEAIEGEMRGVALIVERMAPSGIVYCRAFDEPQLRGVLIPMETHQLLKSIQVGSHIKVQDGKYAGQTGVILERGVLDGDHVAVILTDSGGREITVRFSHVQESSEISKGLDALEGYELHDIVLLPLGAVAVVTYVASEDLEVLTSRGNLRTVRPAEITRKLNQESARNISLDSKDEHVRETDLVILDDGQNAGALATVVRAHRASLWLLNVISGATTIPCGGLFVKKSRQVHVAGDRATGSTLADTYMGLGKQRVVNEDQFNNKIANNRGRSTGRDPFVGRTVRICKGNYKGLAGIVTNATTTHVTVELHTRNRSVTQPRECIKIVAGTAGGEPELAVQRRIAEQEAYSTDLVSTPFLTQATPLLGGATPQYGAVTPHHTTPSRGTATPTWGTPAYSSQTPRGGPQTPRSAPGHGKATTPSYSGIEDVWRPRELPNSKSSGKSPLHSMSPGSFNYLAFSGHSKAKSPMFDGSRASTPTYQPPSVMPPTSKSGAWCVNGAEAELEDGNICKIIKINAQKNMATVALKATQALTRSLPTSLLVRVKPKAGDKVRVVDGSAVYDAELLSIEDSDGIIKVDNGEYKIIDFSAIAKVADF